MHLAIFPFESVSTSDLEALAKRVVLKGKLRATGRSEDRYRSYLAGRCAIKKIFESINAEFKVTPNAKFGYLEVVNEKGGKAGEHFVNVSHTDFISVAAYSTQPIGVDIESRTRSALRVLKRVATERERNWVSESGFVEQNVEIGRDIFLWSAKEAASKALGLGMKFGFQTFEISPTENRSIFSMQTATKGPLKVEEPAIAFEIFEDYFISIASEKSSVLGGVQRFVVTL